MTELKEILDTMDIPEQRKTDMGWLWRNIGVRNSDHPMFDEARLLIKKQFILPKTTSKDLTKGDI